MCDANERLLLREADGVAAEARDVEGCRARGFRPFPARGLSTSFLFPPSQRFSSKWAFLLSVPSLLQGQRGQACSLTSPAVQSAGGLPPRCGHHSSSDSIL